MKLDANEVTSLSNLARLIATCPDDTLRNGTEAVELAMKAVQLTKGQNAQFMQTLAASLAESGRYSDAVQTANQASQLATSLGDHRLAAMIQAESNSYLAGQPYRNPLAVPIDQPQRPEAAP